MVEDYRKPGAPHSGGQWAKGVAAMDERASELFKQGLLPSRFPEPTMEPEQPEGILLRVSERHLTIAEFHTQAFEQLKARGQETVLPEPLPAIVEVYNILAGNGFDVAPVVYVDREKGEVTYGVLEKVARPDYVNNVTKMYYYGNPDDDPIAKFLEKGRKIGKISKGQGIDTPSWAEHADPRTRFFVSWSEIHDYVVLQVIGATPGLAEQVATGGIVLRVPTLAEFQSAGGTHNLVADSWEWVYDEAGLGDRRIAGSRGDGGLEAVEDWQSGNHDGTIGFRLQAVSPSQKLS